MDAPQLWLCAELLSYNALPTDLSNASGIIPTLTIGKVPTATPHVEMQLHFTACQNNRPFLRSMLFGLWENIILFIVTCRLLPVGAFPK